MSQDTPIDPDLLRAEIAQTRTELGDTVEALAAKLDVSARAKDALSDLADQAKDKVRAVRDQAVEFAGSVGDQVRSDATSVRASLSDGDVVAAARKPLPLAGIAVAFALVGLVIYLARRRRS